MFRNNVLVKYLPQRVTSGCLAIAIVGLIMPGANSAWAQEEEAVEEIIVTGSRLVRRDLDAPSPVVSSFFDLEADVSHHSIVFAGLHYIRWSDGSEELYDLRTDIEEVNDLIGTARPEGRLATLRAALDAALRESDSR